MDDSILQGTAAAGALWNLAAHEDNKLQIAQSGVIPSLIRLLSSASVDCKLNACGALQNLCVHPSNKVEVAACGGVQVIVWFFIFYTGRDKCAQVFVQLLVDSNINIRCKAAGALQSLAVHPANQQVA
jgi:hypothetical protein